MFTANINRTPTIFTANINRDIKNFPIHKGLFDRNSKRKDIYFVNRYTIYEQKNKSWLIKVKRTEALYFDITTTSLISQNHLNIFPPHQDKSSDKQV